MQAKKKPQPGATGNVNDSTRKRQQSDPVDIEANAKAPRKNVWGSPHSGIVCTSAELHEGLPHRSEESLIHFFLVL